MGVGEIERCVHRDFSHIREAVTEPRAELGVLRLHIAVSLINFGMIVKEKTYDDNEIVVVEKTFLERSQRLVNSRDEGRPIRCVAHVEDY